MTGTAARLLARVRRLGHAVPAYLRYGKRIEVFGPFTVLERRNVHFGRNVAINHGVFLLGRCGISIGDGVMLSARAMILDSGLDLTTMTCAAPAHKDAPVAIGPGAWIGAGAIILPGVTIGERAVIGAGAVVTKSVPPFTVWAGNPARWIGDVPGQGPEREPGGGPAPGPTPGARA